MTLTRRRIIGCCAALLLATPLGAEEIDINGLYEAQGRNVDGTAYTGQVVISEDAGAVQISWIVGTQTYAGSGRRDGQVVMVNWGDPAPVVYVVMSNGNLHGTWANGTALERLVRK